MANDYIMEMDWKDISLVKICVFFGGVNTVDSWRSGCQPILGGYEYRKYHEQYL